MVKIELRCQRDAFRKFLIISCCKSFIPREYLNDPSVYPERMGQGLIYVEAKDKETLAELEGIQFVRASGVVSITYNSKSGRTSLRWEHLGGPEGRLYGEASPRSILNLIEAGIITMDTVKSLRPAEQPEAG